MATRAAAALGRRPRWLAGVAAEAATAYRDRPVDRPRELVAVDRAGTRPARRPGPAPTAAAACARGDLRARDGADALARARPRHTGRPRRHARPAPRRARLARRPPRPGAARLRPPAAQLSLPLAAQGGGAAAADRAAQAPAQGDPAACAARDPRGDPAARRRPRLPARAFAAHPRPPARRAWRRAAIRPRGLLRLDRGRPRVRRVPRRRIPGGGRRRSHRAGHERSAPGGVGGRATGGRPDRRRGAPAPGPAAGGGAPAAGLPHLARARQPVRLPARLPPGGAGRRVRRDLHAVRRRHRPLRRVAPARRRRLCAARGRGDRARRGLPGEPAQVAADEPRRAP